jgi:hypothetical protein
MEPIEVTARFGPQGEITPLNFTINQKTTQVSGVGRSWADSQGVHILVMAPGEQVYELLFDSAQNRWYLSRPGPERKWA